MDFRQGLPPRARRALDHVAAAVNGPPLDPGLRITLNFHPDRVSGGLPILAALGRDGAYHSQYVTGTSNGGLTAHPGGDRHRWESRIFGGVYDDAPPAERPLYGALNFRHQVVGAAPRFGSSHLRLAGAVLDRATFCYPDSAAEPTDFGVAPAMPLIAVADADEQDPLNDYIESHVHAGVLLARDVEALVLDASYRGTPVETAARHLPFPLQWHPGYRLTVTALRRHADYRGPEYADLGALIAERGLLTPRIIGDAARTGRYALQDLKMVWHTLARFGAPEGAGTAYRAMTTSRAPGSGTATPGPAPSPAVCAGQAVVSSGVALSAEVSSGAESSAAASSGAESSAEASSGAESSAGVCAGPASSAGVSSDTVSSAAAPSGPASQAAASSGPA